MTARPNETVRRRGAARLLRATAVLTTLPLVLCSGCLTLPHPNPAFPATPERLRAERQRMRANPAPLERPVVVLGGYRATPQMAQDLAHELRLLTSRNPDDFLPISYTFAADIDEIAAEVIRRVEERFPSEDPARTVEVDVVGISMGGLVGRVAAMAPEERPGVLPGMEANPGKRLSVRRMFTLASPHRGAGLARHLAPDLAARSMRPGSGYLDRLNEALARAEYEIVPYAVLRDTWVGATRAAPPGADPIWTAGTLLFSHFTVSQNRAIVTDVALRLRGEDPISLGGTPPPRD